MIAHTQHSTPAAARLRTLALLAALALGATFAPASHASGGGVSITADAPSAKAASSEPAATTPPAASTTTGRPRSVGSTQIRRAQTLLRLAVTGKHDPATRKAVKRFQQLRGLAPLGVIDVTTYLQIRDAFALLETGGLSINSATTGAGVGGATTTTTPQPKLPANLAPITDEERAILDKIAQCESKGDPRAISASGQFRGKYQFDRATWRTVGGTGDPAAATEEEQDQRAAILLRQRGTAPWPVCGA